ncbi:MAG: MBL fold metallo-hydrolase [Peptostreptococcaceae bacterium]|nr:MBL fold metallo-hydrolase [Peptostreptococcaceae bacterium]
MKIKFCGAAAGVTGSCHLITTDENKLLLDCGQFQGGKAMDALNFEEFPFNPAEIDFVILSHAHIDHCGRLPLLVKRGFRGKIYCTDATADLLEVMLKDSGYIHEKEAEWKNKKAARTNKERVEPLYTVNDAVDSLKYVVPVLYDQLIALNEKIKFVFNDAGHILGSAIIELWVEENDNVSKIVFSGDLGVMDRPLLRNPTIIKSADYLIMETTYGNRLHPENATSIEELMKIIFDTTKRGGTVVIPSFAVGRTQELIFELNRFYENHGEHRDFLDKVMVYIDSPMATTATEVFRKNANLFDEETKNYILAGDNPLDFKNLKFTRTSDESKALNLDENPKIIISASGMCEAGRIRHHLKHNLWNKKSSIVFVGYQAEGTLGRLIVEGKKDVTLFGEEIHVNAEIHNLEGFSGHADREGLLNWISGFAKQPKQVFFVHGELESKHSFADLVKEKINLESIVVEGFSEFELTNSTIVNREQSMKEAMNDEVLMGVKLKIAKIHDDLETILYNTRLAMAQEITSDKLSAINSSVLELEKSTVNLGAAITKGDNNNI